MKKIILITFALSCFFAFISCKEDKKNNPQNQNVENKTAEEKSEDENPWFMAQTDFAPIENVSATSELVETQFAGDYLYPPVNIVDGNFDNTWCEADENGSGIGEALTIEFKEPVSFDEIQIVNGFAYKDYYKKNNRVKSIQLTQVAGKHFQQKEYVLEDDKPDWQSIKFDLPQTAQTIEIKITDIYKGEKYDDTCLDDVRLLYQGKVIPFGNVDRLKEIQEETSRAMLSNDFENQFLSLFKFSEPNGALKYLVLQSDDENYGIVIVADLYDKNVYSIMSDMRNVLFENKMSYNELEEWFEWKSHDYTREDFENSKFTKIAISVDDKPLNVKLGNCSIVKTERVGYVETNVTYLLKIDGNNVYVNGAHYTVVDPSTVFIALSWY